MEKKKDPELKTLVLGMGAVKYKTLLTKKYLNRKKYVPHDPEKIYSFIPGTILNVFVKKGQHVDHGDKLLILEAMKMKNEILCPFKGKVHEVHVKDGERVTKNQLLIVLKAS